MTVQDQQLQVVQRVHAEWEAEQRALVQPDPAYSVAGRSQYPESIIEVSAPTPAQDDVVARVESALADAGLPSLLNVA